MPTNDFSPSASTNKVILELILDPELDKYTYLWIFGLENHEVVLGVQRVPPPHFWDSY